MAPSMTWPIPEDTFRHWMDVATDWRRPGARESYALYWSDAAKFGQVLPRPSVSAIASFYDVDDYYTHSANGTADEAEGDGFLLRALMAAAWRLDRGAEPTPAWWRSLVPAGAKACLEIGCGDGSNLVQVAPYVEAVVGIEPDPDARAAAAARGIRVLDGLAETLPDGLEPESFDLVLIAHVLEHCRDPIAALANARRLLRPGGTLMVETPNSAALGCQSRREAWYWLDVPRHLNFFTEESLRTLCTHVGLVPQRAEFWGFARQFSAGWIEAETRIEARLAGRTETRADLARNVRRQAALLARAGFAPAPQKYDSVRLICTRP